MNNFIFGQYIPGDSFEHRMNPVTKLLMSFIFVVIVIFANNFSTYLCLTCLAIASVVACKIKLNKLIRGVRPLIWVILFTVIIQLLFTTGGHVYYHWGIINVTSMGVQLSIFILLRFILIITVSTLFTLTTPPLAIAYAIEHVLLPLKKIGVPVETLGMMISIALRFIPTLMNEANTIMNAQKSRGMDFSNGGPITRAKKFVPILIPLFIGAFKHAEELAIAMEARGYQNDAKRTRYHIYRWQRSDRIALLVYLVIGGLVILLRN